LLSRGGNRHGGQLFLSERWCVRQSPESRLLAGSSARKHPASRIS
jgi:hypothetical protein